MSARKGLSAAGIIALTVIAPLCLAIRQLREELELLGLAVPVAAAVSLVLLGCFLAISLAGIVGGYRDHRCRWPVLVGLLSAVAILFLAITQLSALAGYLSCGGLITAGTANIILRRRRSSWRRWEISRVGWVAPERDDAANDLGRTE
ncbi:MAG: hypothetical protein ACYCYH_00665 [Steroidobacteraceae bacterium]